MKSAGIRELKQNASAVVAAVVAGDVVTITDRGRPVARLVPIRSTPLDELVESGRARRAHRKLSELEPIPRRAAGEPELSSVLEEMRAGERW